LKYIIKYYPFNENSYKKFFEKKYGTQLETVSFEESKVIYSAFELIPIKILKDLVSILQFDPSLGKSKEFFPNHGRWEDNFKTMVLNRNVIDLEPEESKHLIIHEIGHAIDNKLGNISKTEEWLNISGWTDNPSGITMIQKSDKNYLDHKNFKRLRIKENGLLSVSSWWYDENAGFVRWYAERNPEEDFAESFAYYILEKMDRFKDCKEKSKFIKNILEKPEYLIKEDNILNNI
jgi:hypothetical protein